MNGKQIALTLVLLDFVALTAWALYEHGIVGWVEPALATPVGITVAVDLCIALGLVLFWIWRDARELGLNPVPYTVVTLLSGSVGPLLYLIRREWRLAEPAARRHQPA